MQVYSGLRILTARPSEADMGEITHHLYGFVDPGATYSTGHWLEDAGNTIADIRARGRLPVLVGGTGLYFRALTGGLSDIPTVPQEIRDHWREFAAAHDADALHAELRRRDPGMGDELNPSDQQRVLRALEVHSATGKSIAQFRLPPDKVVLAAEKVARIVVLPERQSLYTKINARVVEMAKTGALDEVRDLISLGIPESQPLMKAIGVREFSTYLSGQIDLAEAIAKTATATRQYAKRQMTWMRNQLDENWQIRSP